MATRYQQLKQRVTNYEAMVRERAKRACSEAGLDPSLLGIHPHNAMVSLHYGQPWPGVDYKKVRLCLWLTNVAMWRASNLLERYCQRKYAELGNYEGYLFLHTEVKK
jgi:hypothetical protein